MGACRRADRRLGPVLPTVCVGSPPPSASCSISPQPSAWCRPVCRVNGSLPGCLCAVVATSAERSASVPLWISVLVFSPFIIDTSVTLARRVAAGERPWRAHRSHFYQRLVRIGWSHRKAVVREYGPMLACAASAVPALWVPGAQAASGVWAVVYVVLAGRHESRKARGRIRMMRESAPAGSPRSGALVDGRRMEAAGKSAPIGADRGHAVQGGVAAALLKAASLRKDRSSTAVHRRG